MNVPRLLPLIGIAVVGVIGVNALSGARDFPAMLSAARAYAEGVAAPAKGKGDKAKPDKFEAPQEAAKPGAALPPGQSAPAAVGVCAPNAAELAKSAGLSPGELEQLQNLQARRGQIDQQAKDLDTQTALLSAAEVKLDAKLKAMSDLKAQIEALMGQADQKTQSEVDRLTVVYSKMKPADAAAVMATLDDKVRVPIAAAMKPAILSAILGKMATPDAKKLTELLAHRFAPVQALAEAAKAPPAAPPAAPAKPDPKAKPTAQAAAKPNPDDANVDDSADKPAKAKAKPRQLAQRAPAKKKPVYHAPKKAAVEEAKAATGPKPYSEIKDQPAKPADKPATPAATPAAKTR